MKQQLLPPPPPSVSHERLKRLSRNQNVGEEAIGYFGMGMRKKRQVGMNLVVKINVIFKFYTHTKKKRKEDESGKALMEKR